VDCALRRQLGGILGLQRLLREHGEAIEADLHSEYGIRLSQALNGEEGGPSQGRYTARELLNRIHQLPSSSRLMRKLRGPMADWDLNALLLRQVHFQLLGANWQRGGGKSGSKPKPIELPDAKGRGSKPAPSKSSGADIAQRMRNLGLIPAGATE
jgi:hypothetical protein